MIKEIGNYLKSIFLSIAKQWRQRLTERLATGLARHMADAISFILLITAYVFVMIGAAILTGHYLNSMGIGFLIAGLFQMIIMLISRKYIFRSLKRKYARLLSSTDSD